MVDNRALPQLRPLKFSRRLALTKKSIIWLLIFSHLMLVTPVVSAKTTAKKMRIVKIQKDLLAGNKGASDGIRANEIYQIIRVTSNKSYKIIGQAQVVRSTSDLSALKIIEMESGYVPQSGDYLLEQKVFSSPEAKDADVESYPTVPTVTGSDVAFESGEMAGKQMYTSKGAVFAGIASGITLIGWPIGYSIAASKPVDVPSEYLYQLSSANQPEFSRGYTYAVVQKRKKMFNDGATLGAIIGVLTIAAFVANNNSK